MAFRHDGGRARIPQHIERLRPFGKPPFERGLVQRDNTANRTFTDPEPPFAGDSFLTQAVAGYLGVRPDSELDGYIAALEAGAREYNAAHFSNLDASKRLYYTDSGEPGDITFSENDVGFTPGSKTGTGYAVMRSLEKAFSELNPDPKFDLLPLAALHYLQRRVQAAHQIHRPAGPLRLGLGRAGRASKRNFLL